MNRDSRLYLIFHYVVLIAIIFSIAWAIEHVGLAMPLWLGVAIAVVIGLLYPHVVAAIGVEPEGWS